MEGFLIHNNAELRVDVDASTMKAYNFMIGLMADDIEATAGYDKRARIDPDTLQTRPAFRNAVAGRLKQFFGSTSPAAADMYTLRGRLSAEVAREKKLAQSAALRGQTYTITLPVIDPKHLGVPNALS
eukprot:5021392-Heterocapsa_arctica.AAC.1